MVLTRTNAISSKHNVYTMGWNIMKTHTEHKNMSNMPL